MSSKVLGGGRQYGFTLLEMVVVLMVTALVGALIMQGFLYFVSLQQASERQSVRLLQQTQLRALLQDSARTMINGADGIWSELPPFSGDEDHFRAQAYVGLTYLGGVARPTGIRWQLLTEEGGVVLRYKEEPLGVAQNREWYRVRHWPSAQAWFEYKVGGEWRSEFRVGGLNDNGDDHYVLPQGVRLTVDSPRGRQVITVAVPVHPLVYRAPEVEP